MSHREVPVSPYSLYWTLGPHLTPMYLVLHHPSHWPLVLDSSGFQKMSSNPFPQP